MKKYVIQYSIGDELKLNIITASSVEEALIGCGAIPNTETGTHPSAHIEFIYSEDIKQTGEILDADVGTSGIKN